MKENIQILNQFQRLSPNQKLITYKSIKKILMQNGLLMSPLGIFVPTFIGLTITSFLILKIIPVRFSILTIKK